MMKDVCGRCRFYDRLPEPHVGTGWCLRYPPQVLPDLTMQRPLVSETDWCGEFDKDYRPIGGFS